MDNSQEEGSKKILIVEDEESNFELLRAMLRKMNVVVVWAQTGKQAIEACEKDTFDLILMDIKMPEMNGYDAIIKLRDMHVDVPVIAQTAYARLEDEERALAMGFDAYVSKPIDRKRLNEILDTYL